MVSRRAFVLIGSTIPDVPMIDIPPSIPSLGLKVFFAISSPSGTDMVILNESLQSNKAMTSLTSPSIIFLGTELIAALPTS